MADRPKCIHCKRRKAAKHKRLLCMDCYRLRHIRELYPRRSKNGGREPTLAELDALIAERRKCLPKWWFLPQCQPHEDRE